MRSASSSASKKIILSSAKSRRLFKLKGHADLLTAFAKILPQVPQARLLFVGDGALRGEIENQIHALGLDGKVIFAGLVPPGEVPRYVGIMDCLAHLSYREALVTRAAAGAGRRQTGRRLRF